MQVADAYVDGYREASAENAASPGHNFVENGGDDPAMNGVGKAGMPVSWGPNGGDLRAVGAKSEVQTVGIVFSAGKTRLCLWQRLHGRQISQYGGNGKLEFEAKRSRATDNPPLSAIVSIDLLRRICLSKAVIMVQYLELLRRVRKSGSRRTDRTGTGTWSIFGAQIRHALRDGFPLLTTKKLHWKSIVHELLWFLRGDTNIRYLRENGVSIWDDWADENGNLGRIYGAQWCDWRTADGRVVHQIDRVIGEIQSNPHSRRLLVSAWNPGEMDQMSLPPCHAFFQFWVQDGALSCQVYQRSADLFLGVPFNIASYALLTSMTAQVCGLSPGDLVFTFGDAHLYANHLEQADLQLTRQPRPLPTLELNPAVKNIHHFVAEDVTLRNYNPHPHIPAPVAV